MAPVPPAAPLSFVFLLPAEKGVCGGASSSLPQPALRNMHRGARGARFSLDCKTSKILEGVVLQWFRGRPGDGNRVETIQRIPGERSENTQIVAAGLGGPKQLLLIYTE